MCRLSISQGGHRLGGVAREAFSGAAVILLFESSLVADVGPVCLWNQEAARCGIHRTVHAGEVGPPSVVKEVGGWTVR